MNSTNNYGIFKNKKAKDLAVLYKLPLKNKSAYMYQGKFIRYCDVKFIVDNLWISHFQYNEPKPIEVSDFEYTYIYYDLITRLPAIKPYIKFNQ